MKEMLNIIRSQLENNNLGGLDERKTDRYFVSNILDVLGWDLNNLNETILDYSIRGLEQGTEIYYALCSQNRPLLLVDVRPLYSDLANNNTITKTLRTAQYSPAKYLAITNGVEWRVYSIESNSTSLVMIIDVNEKNAEEKLLLLSKDAISQGILKDYLDKHPYEENPVNEKLKTKNRGYQITDATAIGINSLRKKIVNNRVVKDQEISNSLIVETVLSIFLESSAHFIYEDISNAVVLKKRIIDSFKKYFANSDH
jgi:hypothetical protein